MDSDRDDRPPEARLDDKAVTSYVAAQKEVSAVLERAGADPGDEIDPKVLANLERIAQKHGFASFEAFDDVAFNVTLVMNGLNPETGAFVDPKYGVRQEIANVTADKSIPAAEKREILDHLAEELEAMPAKLQFPENVEVVKRHLAAIEDLMQ